MTTVTASGVNKLYVANWKMECSFEQQCALARTYVKELKDSNSPLVICPSFPALKTVQEIVYNSPIRLGAQGCSAYAHGPYTGQVSAESLAQVGCTYCIIGHSEWRAYTYQTNECVAEQYHQLIQNSIIPIVCVGETKQSKNAAHLIIDQIKSLLHMVHNRIYIAYEPLWAIGTGSIPEAEYLQAICLAIRQAIHTYKPTIIVTLLYGGSVNPETIALLNVSDLDGYMIGNASLDVQKLKKIVSYS